METITTTDALARICAEAQDAPYVTLDTEFLRERTYYPQLCLVQMALPGDDGRAVLIDPIEGQIDFSPLYDLLRRPGPVKVFHAARQDLEIFWSEGGVLPDPLFDTQVAAMVCGYGEQVGYETLVRKIARAALDKTSRFTDWSRRPLSDAQMAYALADVTHLRTIYETLSRRLDSTGRLRWVAEEIGTLTDPETYISRPEEAWMRVRTRTNSPRFLALVRELARFREAYAQRRNVPRSRVFKDDVLLELASTKPRSLEDLGKSRLLQREARRGEIAEGILEAVKLALELPADRLPAPVADPRDEGQVNPALAELLRVLLKAKCEEAGVAQKLVATSADLDRIAMGARDVPALHGWRADLFGEDALRLCRGGLALSVKGNAVIAVPVHPPSAG